MISLFKLAYREAEPFGATPSQVSYLVGLIARALALPDHADSLYMLTDDQAERALTPGNAVCDYLANLHNHDPRLCRMCATRYGVVYVETDAAQDAYIDEHGAA